MAIRNIFVVGLNDANRERLERLHGAQGCRFHGVIAPEAVYDTEEFDIASMLAEAMAQLEASEEPSMPSSAIWTSRSPPCCRSSASASAPAARR
ncbi:MAG: hypothetical protein ACOC0M_04970 [Halomonas sp.]